MSPNSASTNNAQPIPITDGSTNHSRAQASTDTWHGADQGQIVPFVAGKGKGRGGRRPGAGRPKGARTGKGRGVAFDASPVEHQVVNGNAALPASNDAADRGSGFGKRKKNEIGVGQEFPDPHLDGTKVHVEGTRGYRLRGTAAMLTYQNVHIPFSEVENAPWWPAVKRFTWALEVGPVTERAHTHLYVEFAVKPDIFQERLRLSNVVPDIRVQRGGGYGRSSYDRAHCYLQVAGKQGSQQLRTNWTLGEDFHPKAEWVMGFFAKGKIQDPRPVLLRYRISTPQLEYRVRHQLALEAKEARAAFKRARRDALRTEDKPFRQIEKVDAWLAGYSVVKHRYDFLWLHGPSKMGKSMFARNLLGEVFVHKNHVSWSGYDPTFHKGIIFDDVHEIHEYVIRNKLMFQSSGEVSAQTSATNLYAIEVDTEQKPIIVCHNDPPTDNWTLRNCVVVACYQEMWLESPPDPQPDAALTPLRSNIFEGDCEERAPPTPTESQMARERDMARFDNDECDDDYIDQLPLDLEAVMDD